MQNQFKKQIFPILKEGLADFEKTAKDPFFTDSQTGAQLAINALLNELRQKIETKDNWYYQKEIDLSDGLRWVRKEAQKIIDKLDLKP